MAVLQENLTLYLPFDESNGSAIAYDYSAGRNDGAVDKASFKAGKIGNCIHFDGNGAVDIATQVINLSGDFTISALVNGDNTSGDTNPTKFGWLIVYSGVGKYIEKWIDIAPGVWTHLVLVKIGSYLRYYTDGALIAEDSVLDGTIVGVSLGQDYYGSNLGKGDLDEMQTYNVALTQDQILSLFDTASSLEYYLDGVNFKDYNVRVSGSSGIVDSLKMKDPFSVNWNDEHGETIDLSDPRFESREITLDCFIKAEGKIDFVNKVNNFFSVFRQSGTHRLMIDINPTKPLVYEVYCPNAIAVSKTWNDELMVGTFSLKLKEPDPVKRVLKHIAVNSQMRTITVTIKSTRLFSIHWGDGEHTYDIGGNDTAQTITHTYAANGSYFPIITGVIESITEFSTNAIVVWNIL